MSGITIKIVRRIVDGHLMYDLEGNLKPIPCGSMVEIKIRDYFKGRTGHKIPREGFFFRIIDRENFPQLHAAYYHERYHSLMKTDAKKVPDREIKFIDLLPTDKLYHSVKSDEKGGMEGLVKEYKEIVKIINSLDDEEDILLIQLQT